MKFKIFTFIIFTAIALIFWIFLIGGKGEKMTGNSDSSSVIFKEGEKDKTNSVSTAQPASSQSAQTKEYENIKYGFSFNYPSDFKASEFAEEDGKTVLTVQNAKTGEGLQIYITAYDDSGFVASEEHILRDVPDLPFSNSADVIVGGKAKGVAFFSRNEAFGGETAEVWFADERNFYQATAYRKDVKILEEIIKSWKFR